MENLKSLLERVNTENPTEFDLRVVSIKKFYLELLRKREIKKLRRLKLLLYLYPSMIYKNPFRSIESIISEPLNKNSTILIKDRKQYTPYEEYAIGKYDGRNLYGKSVRFRVSDLYEYFDLGD